MATQRKDETREEYLERRRKVERRAVSSPTPKLPPTSKPTPRNPPATRPTTDLRTIGVTVSIKLRTSEPDGAEPMLVETFGIDADDEESFDWTEAETGVYEWTWEAGATGVEELIDTGRDLGRLERDLQKLDGHAEVEFQWEATRSSAETPSLAPVAPAPSPPEPEVPPGDRWVLNEMHFLPADVAKGVEGLAKLPAHAPMGLERAYNRFLRLGGEADDLKTKFPPEGPVLYKPDFSAFYRAVFARLNASVIGVAEEDE